MTKSVFDNKPNKETVDNLVKHGFYPVLRWVKKPFKDDKIYTTSQALVASDGLKKASKVKSKKKTTKKSAKRRS